MLKNLIKRLSKGEADADTSPEQMGESNPEDASESAPDDVRTEGVDRTKALIGSVGSALVAHGTQKLGALRAACQDGKERLQADAAEPGEEAGDAPPSGTSALDAHAMRGIEQIKALGSSSQRWLKQAASRLPSERSDLNSLTEMARAAKDNIAAQRDAVQARLSHLKASPSRNEASELGEDAGNAPPSGTSVLDAHARRGIEQLKGLGSTSQRWLKQAASRLPSERPDLKSLAEMARAAKDNVAAQRDALQARLGARLPASMAQKSMAEAATGESSTSLAAQADQTSADEVHGSSTGTP